jgi:ABC-type polysaccharide/polyol phosphate export permease
MHETQLQQTAPDGAAALAGLEWPVERVIAPAKRRLTLSDLIRERAVIRVLAARDFKIKYKQSLLGPLWLVFQPLALLAGFLIAFQSLSNVDSSGLPYAVFTLVGLSAWTYFQASMTIGSASVITNYSFVRFTPCPRPAFPIAALIASLPAFAVTALGAIVVAAITGHLSPRVVLLPLGLLWLGLLTAGSVGILSALTVRYRDITSALPFLLQVGVFLAPIGYTLAGLSPTVRALVELNPITGVVEAWRWMILAGYDPSMRPIAISLVMTGALAVLGWRVFSRLETTMADEI